MIPTFAQTSLYSAVLSLFSSGANGVFLDANDWANVCFQDAAGTTPVTAMEQPVGLTEDKSQNLALGAELISNGSFASGGTGWSQTGVGWSFGGGKATHTPGTNDYLFQNILAVNSYYKITFTISGRTAGAFGFNSAFWTLQQLFFANGTYTVIIGALNANCYFYADSSFDGSVTGFTVKKLSGNHAYQSTSANRPTLTARYNLLLATAVLSTQSVTVGAGSYTLYFTGSGSVALSGAATGTKTAGSNVITCTAGTLTLTVTGSVLTADLRPTDQATGLIPTYQRVNTSTDYDTVGFPIREAYNGSNQYLTGASGGGATTGFFFCAGVMITKVGAAQTLFSDTGTNTGWRVRINASNQLELSAGNGTAYTTIATAGTVSINKLTVVTAWHDGTNLNVQINQGAVAQVAFAVATAGTAGYSLGVDNGASTNYLRGSLGEIVYRTGTAMTAAQIASTQAFVNSKQKAY